MKNEKNKKTELKEQYYVECPLCGAIMAWGYSNNTHAWICEECPAILFEYYNKQDLKNLKNIIN